jgi:hypothetical protein
LESEMKERITAWGFHAMMEAVWFARGNAGFSRWLAPMS